MDNSIEERGQIADQKNIEGIFTNFQYAYNFKDTSIYSGLLNSGFTFIYRDYDRGYDVSWGKEEELKTTYGLFRNAQNLDLIWNNIVLLSSDSTSIIRSFNLTVSFSSTDVFRLNGRVNLALSKDQNTGRWTIERWFDETNY